MKRTKLLQTIISFLLISVLTIGSSYVCKNVFAQTSEESVSIIVEQQLEGLGSDGNSPKVTVTGSNLGEGDYTAYIYYKATTASSFNKKYKTLTEDGTAEFTGYPSLSSGKSYEIYAAIFRDGSEVARSETKTITVEKSVIGDVTTEAAIKGFDNGTITVVGEFRSVAYFPKNGSITNAVEVSGNTISGLAPGEYYVFIPAYSADNKYYLKSSSKRITVPETEGEDHVVRLESVEGADWSGNGGISSFVIKPIATKSVYIKSSDTNKYYISEIKADPAQNAVVQYDQNTGEVFVEKVTGDVTLSPVVQKKSIPETVEVTDVQFSRDGIYSENNAAVKVTIKAVVKDYFGKTVPGQRVYYRVDQSDVSFAQIRQTDVNGVAEFTYSYGIEEGGDKADYTSLFSLTDSFERGKVTDSQDIHLVLQKKKDLVLYEDQIIGTKPNENDGKVINVPDYYELWTGEVHQGALVVGSGKWIRPYEGQFTGLSSGQKLLRAGEKVDTTNNTFYFASDASDFFIPRGVWTVSVDRDASQNVSFGGDVAQTAEPGGTVYIYVDPDEGYEVEEYSVDKPKYVNSLSYDSEGGYVVLEGISGNIILNVKAAAIQIETRTVVEEPVSTDNEPSVISKSIENQQDVTSTSTDKVLSVTPEQVDHESDKEEQIEAQSSQKKIETVYVTAVEEPAEAITENIDKSEPDTSTTPAIKASVTDTAKQELTDNSPATGDVTGNMLPVIFIILVLSGSGLIAAAHKKYELYNEKKN